MKDRETPLNFRMVVVDEKIYIISIECYLNNRDWNYYSDLFTSIGFKEEKNLECPDAAISWKYVANGKEKFESILQQLNYVLKTRWSLEFPEKITEDLTDVSKSLLMRSKFGTDSEGVEN